MYAAGQYRTKQGKPEHYYLAIALAIASVSYNALLAVICARSNIVNVAAVIGCELIILGLGAYVVLSRGIQVYDLPSLSLVAFIAIVSVAVSISGNVIYVDPVRNCMIIALFYSIGRSSTFGLVYKAVLICSFLVLIVIVLEIASISTYVEIFQPAKYISATRGVAEAQFNKFGVFANAVAFEGRFSFGLSNGLRTSSLFIEQVSLSAFSVVIAIFTFSNWSLIKPLHKMSFIFLIVLITLTNESRAASTICALSGIGFFVFPRLRSSLSYCVAPSIIFGAFVYSFSKDAPTHIEDNFTGRIFVTVRSLYETPLLAFFTGDIAKAKVSWDNGYTYVLCSMTIWGAIALYIFVNNACRSRTPDQRRCHWSLSVYVWSWLMIGGTGIFSIKTSALLWLIVGHVASRGPTNALVEFRTKRSLRSYWTPSDGQ